jgi:hypothetical protein
VCLCVCVCLWAWACVQTAFFPVFPPPPFFTPHVRPTTIASLPSCRPPPQEAHQHPSTHKHAECLTRQSCFKASSPLKVASCASCGAKGWNLEASGRISQDGGRLCLVRSQDGSVRTEGCGDARAANATGAFRLVEYRPFFEQPGAMGVHPYSSGLPHAAGGDQGRVIVEGGMVKEEESGLKFPPGACACG